jgi:hypothetical protein
VVGGTVVVLAVTVVVVGAVVVVVDVDEGGAADVGVVPAVASTAWLHAPSARPATNAPHWIPRHAVTAPE